MSKLGLARNLQRYLERYGANISRQIEVFETPQGKLGLRAVGLVQCFDILASIPEHLCIVDTTKYKPESEQSSLKAHAGLISRLINEKVNVQNSKHRLYIETMPKDISHFPRTWTPETWNSFKGTTLHYLYYNNFDRISNQHFDENEKGSAELVEWAQSIVSSRCLGMGGSLAVFQQGGSFFLREFCGFCCRFSQHFSCVFVSLLVHICPSPLNPAGAHLSLSSFACWCTSISLILSLLVHIWPSPLYPAGAHLSLSSFCLLVRIHPSYS
jgi:hypothetical protein